MIQDRNHIILKNARKLMYYIDDIEKEKLAASEILTALVYQPKLEIFVSYIIISPEAANALKGCTMQVARVCPANPESLAISRPSGDQP